LYTFIHRREEEEEEEEEREGGREKNEERERREREKNEAIWGSTNAQRVREYEREREYSRYVK
jgi:hypothetical protein